MPDDEQYNGRAPRYVLIIGLKDALAAEGIQSRHTAVSHSDSQIKHWWSHRRLFAVPAPRNIAEDK